MPADQQVNKQPCGDDSKDDHPDIALLVEHAAHHDRAHKRRSSSCKRKNEESSVSEFRNSCCVGYEVFGEAGDQKQGEHDRKASLAVELFDKTSDFFFSKEQVYPISSENSCKVESAGGSKRDPYYRKQIAKPKAIGITGSKLNELTGYHRYYDLRDL